MADSLFDNRYRYDYIYPRGRSGETLRAVDTRANNRPVVVKRPAPNDAPPIRAGQEVSILNERKALTRLAGHPVLTELLGTGQFFVGGSPHQYIVVERAEGAIVADMVRELAAQGERLPELEMLVIVDLLLDLLARAHQADIVYNDVDAKHLFWDRDAYRLKLIDWGNAVLLEGDEITPQGVSRQSDVAQVGELLYFLITGGGRPDVPRNASDDFKLYFGEDQERIHSRLQAIISRAVHPNLRVRYASIDDLRKDLADYRAPLVRERDTILGRVNERLRRDRSRDELLGLLSMLEPALAQDPGYPSARELRQAIEDRLQDLQVAGDLDAIRIYMESGNWSRAADLLNELRQQARDQTAMLIHLLLDFAMTILDADTEPPAEVYESLSLLFEGQAERAAHVLVTVGARGDRHLCWLLAERISAHVPEVHILRPNLYRLETALSHLAVEHVPVTEPRAVLNEINTTLDNMPVSDSVSLIDLRDRYRAVVDGLTALNTLLDAVSTGRNLPDRKLPFSALERATNAAMSLADNMHVIGRQAAASPRDALHALDTSRLIDPTNLVWDKIAALLDELYAILGTYQTYVPAADGSDLEGWLKEAHARLEPFTERLFDEMLLGMVQGLGIAERGWQDYAAATVEGNRLAAVTALARAADAVGTISPTLSGWFNQLRSVVANANYIERHALYGGLGRALADGWEAFDRGRLADAEQLGQRAYEIARDDRQRAAASRLRQLAEVMRAWIDRNGARDPAASKAALVSVERLYTVAENETRENFTRQMPSKETYLKAMSKGLVELYSRSNTAAVRILFVNYILLGTLDAQEDALDDAEFWRQAAVRALDPYGQRHIATRTLETFITQRRDINEGAATLNQVTGPHALPQLDEIIKALEDNPQARLLSAGVHSLRELQAALRDWSDGEFRPAGIKLENAINAVDSLEQAAAITATPYRGWLLELQAATAELYTRARQLGQIVDSRPAQPDPALHDIHQSQFRTTLRLLGETHAATLRQWLESYDAFQDVYTDPTLRRSARLSRFNELFRVMFIDRHPAYPLYRHWYNLTEQAPEFPAPPTDDPTPRIDERAEVHDTDFEQTAYAEPPAPRPARRLPRLPLLLGGAGLILVLLLLALLSSNGAGTADPLTVTASTEPEATTAVAQAIVATTAAPTTAAPSATFTPVAVASATGIAPTATQTTTDAPTATASPTPTVTPTATLTLSPTPTLPPEGLQGRQDLLAMFDTLDTYPWSDEQFSRGIDGAFWRLGVGATTPGDIIWISLPDEMLEQAYGNNAAGRITRAEATLSLTTYNPPLLLDGAVYFGLTLHDANLTGGGTGLHVQLVEPGVINLGQRVNGEVRTISQRSVTAVVVRARLDYDAAAGTITVYFNDEQLGEPLPWSAERASPALFVKDGGVIVSVTDWTITLR